MGGFLFCQLRYTALYDLNGPRQIRRTAAPLLTPRLRTRNDSTKRVHAQVYYEKTKAVYLYCKGKLAL